MFLVFCRKVYLQRNLSHRMYLKTQINRSTIATQIIHGERCGNSNWHMGQILALSSTSIAQDGHSFVFTVS
ncbi:hypothetical protein J2X69_000689 [Algoriphagus sp. 4150]|nr:hypothetical protein [Algoriphagus sp. 4150]